MQSNIRIIELLRFLYQQTDEAHAVTVSEMIEYLKSKGIPSVRQTVYTDLEALDTAGIDIVQIKSTQNRYFIGSRIFEYSSAPIPLTRRDWLSGRWRMHWRWIWWTRGWSPISWC